MPVLCLYEGESRGFIGVKETPVGKLASNGFEFDPKAFLAKVGTGQAILKFEKASCLVNLKPYKGLSRAHSKPPSLLYRPTRRGRSAWPDSAGRALARR